MGSSDEEDESEGDNEEKMVDKDLQMNGAECLPSTKVLIVDDCCFNIIATRSLIRQLNLEADAVQHSKDLMGFLRDREARGLPMYELIMMDYSMPGLNGKQCTQLVRKFVE